MLPLGTWAQIDVTATAGTPGPTSYSLLDEAWMEGIGDERTLVHIADLSGRVVWQHTIQGRTEFPADLLRPGLYTYTMSTVHGRFCTGKLVIAR